MDKARLTTAISIADAFGLDPKRYRAALRREYFEWHEHRGLWLVSPDSVEQEQMLRIAKRMWG